MDETIKREKNENDDEDSLTQIETIINNHKNAYRQKIKDEKIPNDGSDDEKKSLIKYYRGLIASLEENIKNNPQDNTLADYTKIVINNTHDRIQEILPKTRYDQLIMEIEMGTFTKNKPMLTRKELVPAVEKNDFKSVKIYLSYYDITDLKDTPCPSDMIGISVEYFKNFQMAELIANTFKIDANYLRENELRYFTYMQQPEKIEQALWYINHFQLFSPAERKATFKTLDMDKADYTNFFSGVCCNNNIKLAQLLINEYGYKPTNKVLSHVREKINKYVIKNPELTSMKQWLESLPYH